jgi:hypothetical protein
MFYITYKHVSLHLSSTVTETKGFAQRQWVSLVLGRWGLTPPQWSSHIWEADSYRIGQEISCRHGTRRFIAVNTSACNVHYPKSDESS